MDNSTVLKGDVVEEVAKLKDGDGEIVSTPAVSCAHADGARPSRRVRLIVFPVVLGGGERLFGTPATRRPCASSTPGPSATASPT